MQAVQHAQQIFTQAVHAVQPQALLPRFITIQNDQVFVAGKPIPPTASIYIAAAGKAAASMLLSAEQILGTRIQAGLAVTQEIPAHTFTNMELFKADHPTPGEASIAAGEKMRAFCEQLKEGDVLIFLLSGGASALLADVVEGVTLEDMQVLSKLLLRSGANISEMNVVRKHLSYLKGGQLAKMVYPSTLFTLAISDVPGNDPSVIGSGPTVGDPSTIKDALAVLKKYQLLDQVPASIATHLQEKNHETPFPSDIAFEHTFYQLIATNETAIQAAAEKASELGYHVTVLQQHFSGEARDLGQQFIEQAMAYDGATPACLLAGGESTVTVKGEGLGGRNQEMALAAGLALHNTPGITILCAGTDGKDGPTDAAGAYASADIMTTMQNGASYLQANNAYPFFEQTGSLLKTGATHTNVMDLVVILIAP
ncbi:hydroxypyruvate reductase [Chitinophaga skermanii]|uniref:Hydroxypyruvate reductase n=1 Tax=Chitinophaga skermanii TaxID=331697 RepID=A0A327R5X8_9BACT|nr:DUF4147 domain-containing protein [Chitinophaga skermanii]RAJ10993.1 hydroxypyruvate reductase [Chitinophaga skermanii]